MREHCNSIYAQAAALWSVYELSGADENNNDSNVAAWYKVHVLIFHGFSESKKRERESENRMRKDENTTNILAARPYVAAGLP